MKAIKYYHPRFNSLRTVHIIESMIESVEYSLMMNHVSVDVYDSMGDIVNIYTLRGLWRDFCKYYFHHYSISPEHNFNLEIFPFEIFENLPAIQPNKIHEVPDVPYETLVEDIKKVSPGTAFRLIETVASDRLADFKVVNNFYGNIFDDIGDQHKPSILIFLRIYEMFGLEWFRKIKEFSYLAHSIDNDNYFVCTKNISN